jgi:hypothetical protein
LGFGAFAPSPILFPGGTAALPPCSGGRSTAFKASGERRPASGTGLRTGALSSRATAIACQACDIKARLLEPLAEATEAVGKQFPGQGVLRLKVDGKPISLKLQTNL